MYSNKNFKMAVLPWIFIVFSLGIVPIASACKSNPDPPRPAKTNKCPDGYYTFTNGKPPCTDGKRYYVILKEFPLALLIQVSIKLGNYFCYFNFQLVIVIQKGPMVLHVMILVNAIVNQMSEVTKNVLRVFLVFGIFLIVNVSNTMY